MHPVMSEINPSKISEAKNIKLFFVCLFFVSLDPVPPGEESDLITSVKFMLHRFTSASFPGFHWSHPQAFINLIPRLSLVSFPGSWRTVLVSLMHGYMQLRPMGGRRSLRTRLGWCGRMWLYMVARTWFLFKWVLIKCHLIPPLFT